jgi:hypothetical protein
MHFATDAMKGEVIRQFFDLLRQPMPRSPRLQLMRRNGRWNDQRSLPDEQILQLPSSWRRASANRLHPLSVKIRRTAPELKIECAIGTPPTDAGTQSGTSPSRISASRRELEPILANLHFAKQTSPLSMGM